jgi:ElaB/YqjD/DUF883 family membrane-anchored ribosome-binding protein
MAQRTVRDDYQALRDDLQQLRSDLSALADSVVEGGKDRASTAKQSAIATARERLERIAEQASHARSRGLETVENVERQVASRPWRAVATVFGAGLLIGMILNWLLGRRKE